MNGCDYFKLTYCGPRAGLGPGEGGPVVVKRAKQHERIVFGPNRRVLIRGSEGGPGAWAWFGSKFDRQPQACWGAGEGGPAGIMGPSGWSNGGHEFKPWKQPLTEKCKLKRWERKKCKPNSLPVLHKMHVKLGDTVKVISGHDKGKIGEITDIMKHNSKVVVSEINLKTKHVKSRSEDEPGQIIKIEAPIHSSNVMLYSKEQKVTSRVGHKTLDNGKRVRYLIKTGEIIDSAENWKKAVKEKEKTKEAVAAAAS
ncbi:50S ribosomal protein L24, chloroplastic [Capsicum baccatum]|uniref:50S ribosomal protein L24, chloroplastic n=1 Tax=Capsicum baccatum TaxID=33114 RepID=A0A2G2VR26_CAPBA|nr:50S ribosomal protein L24, chloroplastic [Capsicum baccatum]